MKVESAHSSAERDHYTEEKKGFAFSGRRHPKRVARTAAIATSKTIRRLRYSACLRDSNGEAALNFSSLPRDERGSDVAYDPE